LCLLYAAGMARFDFYCDGELVPTFSRFKRVHTPRSRVVAVFVGDHCDYRFSVDTLPCGKRALRELRRRLASQFSYWKAKRSKELRPLRKPVSFVRGKAPVKSPRRKQQAEVPTFWGSVPSPKDSRVVGTGLELPAHRVIRDMPKQPRTQFPIRVTSPIPLRGLSSVVDLLTSDKRGEPKLPDGDPHTFPDHRVSDLAASGAISRFERIGALREVSRFESPLADRFGPVSTPAGGDGAFGRLEAQKFGGSGRVVEPVGRESSVAQGRETSSREVSSFDSSALSAFF